MNQPQNLPVKNLLDELSQQDLDKIQAHQASIAGGMPVDEEWLILAEWLKLAGWQAYLDAKNDATDKDGNLIVTMPEILTLLEASRKLQALDHYKNAHSSFIGAVSATQKKPSRVFKSLTKNILDRTKVV